MKNTIAVIGGAGHIGLPLSCLISNQGMSTIIIDNNKESIEKIQNKISPFYEEGLNEQLEKAIDGGLQVTKNMNKISECNIVIITLGTSSKTTDIENFNSLVQDVITLSNDETMVILRSTLSAGTMENIIQDYSRDKNLKFIYAPERIAEGKALKELREMPQIIGCHNHEDYLLVESFFNSLGVKTLKMTFKEAEFLKLFLNTYRYLQFSTLNFFENIANKYHIDFKNVLELASKEYPRLEGVPDSGFVGGPCLIKDSKTFANSYPEAKEIVQSFLDVNDYYVKNIIQKCKHTFSTKKIIQLGLTFKPNSDDIRDSQALRLYETLLDEGYNVKAFDPYVHDSNKWEEIKDFSENIIIATNHKEFEAIKLNNKKVIIIGKK
ncbi:MAG: nucleotide sugar dehydrogenase [Flavobacteriales bacterium]|nr:nucleotide sugar dehydrogenase [Flavobacteriales bacterium]